MDKCELACVSQTCKPSLVLVQENTPFVTFGALVSSCAETKHTKHRVVEDEDISAQGQANTVDVLMFSRTQLVHVVDFTISQFAEKRALPASMFSDLADMAKQALPDAGEGSADPKDIPQSQVSKVIEFITKGCDEIAASSTKDDKPRSW